MSKIPFHITSVANGKKTAELRMSGYISPYENNANEIVGKLEALEEKYDTITINLMNLYGGSIIEGMVVAERIKNSSKKIITKVEGLAASMGAIIFEAGHERVMVGSSRLMLHKAAGGVYGTATEIRDYADMVDSYEDDLVDSVAERTSRKKDDVVDKFFNGKDNYFNGKQAIKEGLSDKHITGKVTEEPPSDILDPELVAGFYNAQIIKTENNMNSLKATALKLGLPENATQADIDAKIEAMQAAVAAAPIEATLLTAEDSPAIVALTKAVETLTAKVNANENKGAEALVDTAIEQGKITAAQKETFLNLAKSNPEAAKAAFDGMVAQAQLRNIGKGGNGGAAPEGKKLSELMEEDPEAVIAMKKEDPENYRKLFKAEYGFEYVDEDEA